MFAFCIIAVMAKAYTLKGSVKDESQQALSYASVYVEDAHMGATTDLDGNYTIRDIPAGKHRLVVSFVGYKTQTLDLSIEADDTRNFTMEEQVTTLNDVFVTPTGESLERFILSQTVKHSRKLKDVMNSFTCKELYRLEQRNNQMKVLLDGHMKALDLVLGILGMKGFFHAIIDHPDLKIELASDIQFRNKTLTYSGHRVGYCNTQLTDEEKNAFTKTYKKKHEYHYEKYYDKLASLKTTLEKMDRKKAGESEKHLKYVGSYDENGKVVHILQYDNELYHIVDGCWQLRRMVKLKEKGEGSGQAETMVEFYQLARNVFLPISYYNEGSLDIEEPMKKELEEMRKEDTSKMKEKALKEHNTRIERLQKAIEGEGCTYKVSCAMTYTDFEVNKGAKK